MHGSIPPMERPLALGNSMNHEGEVFRVRKSMAKAGFSLVEVMIVLAIMSVAGLGIMSMLQVSYRGTATVNEKLAIMDLTKTLISIADGKNICFNDFNANPMRYTYDLAAFPVSAPIPLDELYLHSADPSPFVKKGAPLTGQGAVVSDMTLENVTGTGNRFIGDLVVSFGSTLISRQSVRTKVNIQAKIDADTSTISLVGCNTGTSRSASTGNEIDSEGDCEALGGTWIHPTVFGRPDFCVLDNDIIEWY